MKYTVRRCGSSLTLFDGTGPVANRATLAELRALVGEGAELEIICPLRVEGPYELER